MENEKIIVEVDEGFLEEAKEEKKTVRVLVFSLGDENYCIEIKQAKEVIKLSEVTRVPNAPEFITGIINLRGEIIALVDPHYFFGLEKKEKTQSSRVVITDASGSSVGILVDSIEDAIDIEESLIQPPLVTLNEKVASFTKGQIQLADKILILLDMEKVLNCDEINKLRKGAG